MQRYKETGSILIMALWTLTLLTIFAVSLARGASQVMLFAKYIRDKSISHSVAKAGIKKGIQIIVNDEFEEYDSLLDPWSDNTDDFQNKTLGIGTYSVSYNDIDNPETVYYGIMDEERKININKASKDVLSTLVSITSELGTDEAGDIAAAIIDWRDAEDDEGDAEDSYYEGLTPSYSCKDADFESVEELLLIKGITPEIFSGIKGHLTVYGDGKINVNTAGQTVFEALGITSASQIISYRSTAAFESIGSEVGALVSEKSVLGLLSTVSNNFRIRAQGKSTISDSAARTVEVVVDRADGMKVVYYRES